MRFNTHTNVFVVSRDGSPLPVPDYVVTGTSRELLKWLVDGGPPERTVLTPGEHVNVD